MSQEEVVSAYARGQIGRRTFIRRMVMTGVSIGAALSYADLLRATPAAAQGEVVDDLVYSQRVSVFDFYYDPQLNFANQAEIQPWWFFGTMLHKVRDASGMGLFGSGLKNPGGKYQFQFFSAGKYDYYCDDTSHPAMAGTISVPLIVAPSEGPLGTVFEITWSATTAFTGYVFDIQVKNPGSATWTKWLTRQTARQAPFTPTEVGLYRFRARMRKPSVSAATKWSIAKKITVTP